jgi:isopentenyl diphosphate isomerase/L-lactate dehydrogenase-like FMN-dependent dehydrogenase
MLALGADAVMVGRPLMQAAAGGAEGVAFAVENMILQLKLAMIMTGVENIAAINSSIVHNANTL